MAGEKVLVVDDDPSILLLAVRGLERQGYRVYGAASAQEALDLIKKERFDLVLTDIVMPGLDGLELIEKARERRSDLAAVVITGYGTVEMAVKSLRVGVLDFVIKPFTIDELRTTVEEALERHRLAAENVRLRTLLHVFEVSRSFAAELETRKLLPLIITALAQETKADPVSLLLINQDTQELVVKAVRGSTEDLLGSSAGKIGEGLIGWVAERGLPVLLPDEVEVGDSFGKWELDPDAASILAVPLVAHGIVIGAVEFRRRTGEKPFGDHELEIASLLCSHAAVAIQNAYNVERLHSYISGTITDAFHKLWDDKRKKGVG